MKLKFNFLKKGKKIIMILFILANTLKKKDRDRN